MNHHSGSLYYLPVIIGFLFLCFGTTRVNSQLSKPGHPFPLEYKGSPALKVYDITVTKEQKTKALAGEGQSILKPARSGLLVDVSFSPENSGTWDTLSDGTRIWRIALYTDGASMMNLVFSPYQLNKGVRVYLYDRKQQTVLGAFTDQNNKPVNMLATAQIPGDLLIVEIQVPQYLESLGSLVLSGVGYDFSYRGDTKSLKDGWFGISGSCNIDINCDNDSLVQRLKNAVVRIVYNGSDRCTGTLVNNTRRDGISYVLTAEHCISKEIDANTAVFYFDYESPYCHGPDGTIHKSLSGATIRATGDRLDFTLLELLEPIPFTYLPYFAGWDYSGNQPKSGYSIHHPLGDVKKISREDHALNVASSGEGYDNNTHWRVRHWESGTTEPGSSGCAFFNNFGLIVGTLTGGIANCTNSVYDYFQMFSHSWADYPSQYNQLASWLDPLNLHNGYLRGYEPFMDFRSTGDTLSNILNEELLTTLSGTLTWGSYSGHNSEHLTGFAERFTLSDNKKIPGLLLHTAKNYVAGLSSKINIKIWNGTTIPHETLFEKSIPLADLSGDALNFIEFDSVVSVGESFFAGYELEYAAPQDTFSTYMAENRLTDPYNTAYVYDGYNWQSLVDYTGGAINSSFAIMPLVFDSIPVIPDNPKFNDNVIVYPNPAGSQIWLKFREMSVYPVQVTLYNMQGQMVLESNYGPYQHIIPLDVFNNGSGLYILRVKEGNLVHNLKIAIIK
jgi:lysyl endopeptidase